MGAAVTKREATPESTFICRDCGKTVTGREVQAGVLLYYADKHREPLLSTYRCEECFDDRLKASHH